MVFIISGGTGFIDPNFIFDMLRYYLDYKILCLDKLTYAGNLSTVAPVMEKEVNKFYKKMLRQYII